MKIYTRKGDQGRTSLFGGGDYRKDDIRIEAYGTIDELNSFIGALADAVPAEIDTSSLFLIQNALFDIGANLATKQDCDLPMDTISESDIHTIEGYIDMMSGDLEPLRHFLLPGGHPIISKAHICRTICRRAERRLVSLDGIDALRDKNLLPYINRISDFFFVFGRFIAKRLNIQELHWKGRDQKDK